MGGAACSADFGARGRSWRGVLLEPPLRTWGFFSPPALCLLSFFFLSVLFSRSSQSSVLLSRCNSCRLDSATLPGTGGTVRFGFEDHNAASVATTGRPAARAPFMA